MPFTNAFRRAVALLRLDDDEQSIGHTDDNSDGLLREIPLATSCSVRPLV
jgi:hypothetical protein